MVCYSFFFQLVNFLLKQCLLLFGFLFHFLSLFPNLDAIVLVELEFFFDLRGFFVVLGEFHFIGRNRIPCGIFVFCDIEPQNRAESDGHLPSGISLVGFRSCKKLREANVLFLLFFALALNILILLLFQNVPRSKVQVPLGIVLLAVADMDAREEVAELIDQILFQFIVELAARIGKRIVEGVENRLCNDVEVFMKELLVV